jgi:hypothetical protein
MSMPMTFQMHFGNSDNYHKKLNATLKWTHNLTVNRSKFFDQKASILSKIGLWFNLSKG